MSTVIQARGRPERVQRREINADKHNKRREFAFFGAWRIGTVALGRREALELSFPLLP